MAFINTSGIIGQIIERGTETITGDIVITLLILFLVLVAFAMMFQIKLIYLMILLIPFVLAVSIVYSAFFLGILGVFILIIAFFIANKLSFN